MQSAEPLRPHSGLAALPMAPALSETLHRRTGMGRTQHGASLLHAGPLEHPGLALNHSGVGRRAKWAGPGPSGLFWNVFSLNTWFPWWLSW